MTNILSALNDDDIGRFWSLIDRSDGQTSQQCWLWQGKREIDGYGRFYLRRSCGLARRILKAHRVMYLLMHGELPDHLCVLHRCDNPPCVRPDHLFLGTNADNVADRVTKGRSAVGDKNGLRIYPERRARGERNASARLTIEQVIEIRRRGDLAPAPHRYEIFSEMSREYGVSVGHIGNIVYRKKWRHV